MWKISSLNRICLRLISLLSCMLVLVEHVRENFLGVLESLGHFRVG